MSTKAKLLQSIWQQKVDAQRVGVSRTLSSIENGELDMADFEKLHNFCMTALVAMEELGAGKWSAAKMRAEMLDLLHTRR